VNHCANDDLDDARTITIMGLKTPNPGNGSQGVTRKGHLFRVHRRKMQRRAVAWATLGHEAPPLPCRVTLTRISPGTLDAHDNLRAALKPVVDEVTAWLGLESDADPRVTWDYQQRKGARKTKTSAAEHGVEIRVDPA
jgi:hypothetical protein